MRSEASVVHRIPGRVRLRIAGKRRDAVFFSKLAEGLMACPGVTGVAANSLTETVLLAFDGPFEAIVAEAEARQLFRLAEPSPYPPLRARVAEGMDAASRNLEAVSAGEVDLDGLLVLGLAGLAIHQAIEGNIMAPAVSLLWYALQAARGKQRDGVAATSGQAAGEGSGRRT